MSKSTILGLHQQGASAAWSDAGRDALRGVAIVGGKLLVFAGFLLVFGSIAMLVSEQARDRAASFVLARVGVEALSAKPEPQPEVAQARPGRWSDWLAAAPAGRIEPEQDNVARYLAQRYRVADGAVRHIVVAAFSTGRSIGVDPMLILAVTAIESSMNPFAQSSMGAQGLMQVMTRLHSEKFVSHGGDHAALDPIANLKVGAEILKDLIERGGSVQRGLQLYVGAGNLPDDGGYAARVLGEHGRIKLASTGKVRSALTSGWRADHQVRSEPVAPEILPTGTDDDGSARRRGAKAAST